MSTTFWAFGTGSSVLSAAAPWADQSYFHSWIDAAYWGLAAFCALKCICAALSQQDRQT